MHRSEVMVRTWGYRSVTPSHNTVRCCTFLIFCRFTFRLLQIPPSPVPAPFQWWLPPLLSPSVPEAKLTAALSGGDEGLWCLTDRQMMSTQREGEGSGSEVSLPWRGWETRDSAWGRANKGAKLKLLSPPVWMMIGWFITLVSAFSAFVNV